MAEWLNCRVVIAFLNFPHIRSWDRSNKWQSYLLKEIQEQTRVSYTLIATVAESWMQHSNLQAVLLGPMKQDDLQPWIVDRLAVDGLQFDSESGALKLFLDYIHGHVGDAIALARRIWLDHLATFHVGSGKKAEREKETREQGKTSKLKALLPLSTPHSPLPISRHLLAHLRPPGAP